MQPPVNPLDNSNYGTNPYGSEPTPKSNAGQGLGIAGLVLGIIGTLVSFIPCIGTLAFLVGGIGVVLSAVGYSQARKNNGAKGLTLAGLILSIVGIVIAGIWLYALNRASGGLTDAYENTQRLEKKEFASSQEFLAEYEEWANKTVAVAEKVKGGDLSSVVEMTTLAALSNVYEKKAQKFMDEDGFSDKYNAIRNRVEAAMEKETTDSHSSGGSDLFD